VLVTSLSWIGGSPREARDMAVEQIEFVVVRTSAEFGCVLVRISPILRQEEGFVEVKCPIRALYPSSTDRSPIDFREHP